MAFVEHTNTGTAADLLSFTKYTTPTGEEHLTRVATASEQWAIQDWDGERYVIKFDKNFSKKHLFTFTKKTKNVAAKAYSIHAEKPGKSEAENWNEAEHELLVDKLCTTLAVRSGKSCTCGHLKASHKGKPNTGACKEGGCGCLGFSSAYAAQRLANNKPVLDPLLGANANKNTCIILNYVPKAEFETVLVQALQAEEKPSGWTQGDPLAKSVTDVVSMKWDFGSSRLGVIVQADMLVWPDSWKKFQGCWVEAKKVATDLGVQTWEIFHLKSGVDKLTNVNYDPF